MNCIFPFNCRNGKMPGRTSFISICRSAQVRQQEHMIDLFGMKDRISVKRAMQRSMTESASYLIITVLGFRSVSIDPLRNVKVTASARCVTFSAKDKQRQNGNT